MRRIYSYSIRKESILDMLHAKRHHPCLEITYRDRSGQYTHKLSAGYGDELYVYGRDRKLTFYPPIQDWDISGWRSLKEKTRQENSSLNHTR